MHLGDDDPVAVISLGSLIAVWYLATHGKGIVVARLVAWLLLPVVAWIVIAVTDTSVAVSLASSYGTGWEQAVTGVVKFFQSGP